jgi:hypothetical protein
MKIERHQQCFFHAYGAVLSVDDFNYGYIPIPKCASTYLKNYFIHNFNFSYDFNYKREKNKRYIVCLRDPIDRWYTGIAEYFFRFHKDFLDNPNHDIIKFICDRKMFDEHTELQRNFLEGLDTDQITFFYADKELIKNIKHFVSFKFVELKNNNVSEKKLINNFLYFSPEKVKFVDVLKTYILENPKYIDDLKSFYQYDYDLIRRIKFYNRKDTDIL